jgi:hypothetical protein
MWQVDYPTDNLIDTPQIKAPETQPRIFTILKGLLMFCA